MPGPVVEARQVVVQGTRAVGRDGDGVYVGSRARLTFDPEMRSDAVRGFGSQILGNARVGVLVSGQAELSLSGARVAYNLGPGVYAQDSAVLGRLGYTWFQQNRGLSVGVTPTGTVRELLSNGITETIPARLATDLGTLDVGDGVSIAGSVMGMMGVAVQQNVVQRNSRFGMLFTGPVTATLMENRVSGNGFPIGAYNGAVVQGTGYDRAAQPSAAPGVARPAF